MKTKKNLHRFSVVSVCFFALLLASAKGYGHTIVANVSGLGGGVTPFGTVTVADGGSQTFTIGPSTALVDVYVDGMSMGAITSYTFSSVTADHSIIATFACSANQPVRLDSDGSSYSSITAAYNAAVSSGLTNFTLDLMAGTLPQENLTFNSNVSVTLNGGFDCSFQTDTMTSALSGSMTIAAGSVISSNMGVSSTPACQPGDANNFPGNAEICDGQDNNCNGQIDEGLSTDADGDGYYAAGSCMLQLNPTLPVDCDDHDATVNPGAAEICDNKDNNCNGQIDEGFPETDIDGDGYAPIGSCGSGTLPKTDCNDNDASINPGATEIWGDGIDQNCDGREITSTDMTGCVSCHGAATIRGYHSNDPSTTPPTIHIHTPDSTCVSCHAWVTSSLLDGHYGKTIGPNTDGLTVGSKIDCNSCHDESATAVVWPRVLAVVVGNETCDTCHLNRVAEHDTNNAHVNRVIDSGCAECHTSDTTVLGQPGSGTLTSQSDVDTLHRSDCTLCHAYSGTLLDPATVAQAIQNGINGAQITCTTCHTVQHHTNGLLHFDPTVDTSQATVTPCDSCHHVYDDKNGTHVGLSTFTAILWQHDILDGVVDGVGACQTCHSYAGGSSEDPTVVANAISSGQPATCATCHTDKVPNVSHGGHTATTFVWNGDCATCHTDGGLGIVAGVHKNTCTLCHNNPLGGKGTTIAGTYGDATLGAALADFTTAGCLTCHPGTTYPEPWVHHNTASATSGNCVNCHNTTSGHAGNHTNTVSLSPDCSLCHTGTEGGVNNVPVDPANSMVHNACTSCHTIDATTGNVVLIDPTTNPLVIAMPDGGTPGGTDGGGDCTACHGAYFPNHQNVDHTTYVAGTATCITCHTATAGTATGEPVSTTDNKVHDACSSCHDTTTGALLTVTAPGGSAPIAPGDCTVCHGAYFPNHTHHFSTPPNQLTFDPTVDTSQPTVTPCDSCHHVYDDKNGTNVGLSTFTAILWQHDVLDGVVDGIGACQTCHYYTGGMSEDPAVVSNAISSGQPATCATCHTDKVPNVSHGGHTATTFVWDGDCNTCHTDGGLGIVAGVHKNTCTLCHNNPNGGTGTTITGTYGDATLGAALADFKTAGCLTCHPGTTYPEPWIHHNTASATSGNCVSCHNTTSGHAGNHTNTVSLSPDCSLCHTGTEGGVNNVPVDPANNMVHNACTSCHTIDATTGNVVLIDPTTNPLVIAMPDGGTPGGTDGGGDCTACHGAYFPNHQNVDHTTYVAGAANCITCHTATAGTTTGMPVSTTDNKVHNACSSCHDTTTGALLTVTAPGGTAPIAPGDCTTCHGQYFPNHQNVDHTTYAAGTSTCITCHTATAGTATGMPVSTTDNMVHDACSSCHDYSTGQLLTVTAPGGTAPIAPGDCTTCHGTDAATTHHTNGNAANGNCTWCHADPRPTWTTLTSGDNGGSSLYPTQLGCAECHVQFSGTTANIYKITYNQSLVDSRGNPIPYSQAPTRTVVHTISGVTSGYIYNYGMCFSCHNGTTAPAVSPFHAQPTTVASRNRQANMAYAPGFGSFNLQWSANHGQKNASFGTKSYRSHQNDNQNPAISFQMISIPCATYNSCSAGTSTIDVPVLPAQPVPTPAP